MSFTGSADDITVGNPPIVAATPFIEEDTLDETLRAYLQALVERRPFAFEVVIDERHVMDRLAAHWPHEAADLPQAEPLWQRIDQLVQSMPVIRTTPVIMLRVIASASPLAPQSIPSPHNHSALATFDAVDGKFYRCVLPALQDLPPLEAMKVPAGVMAIAQPVPTLVSQFSDNRSTGLGASNIYGERSRVSHAPQHKVAETAAEPPPAAPPPGNTLG